MSGSVAFIIDIAGAKLRNAHLRLLTLLCSLQSGAGVRSATLNRCAPPIGKTGPVALWSPQPIFPCCFLTYLRRFGLVSYTYREHKKRSAPSLNTFVRTRRGFGYTQAYIERLIGSIRRECLDHVIVFGEGSLHRTLTAYFAYYHDWRTHLSLVKDIPRFRQMQPSAEGKVIEIREVGGLHHHYERRAA